MQIKVFIEYRPKTIPIDKKDEETLLIFARMSGKNDISEITHEDRERFRDYLQSTGSAYSTMCAMHKVDALLHYFHFHTKVKVPKRLGRPLNFAKIVEVKTLTDQGMSYREVQRRTGTNLSLISRWNNMKFRPWQ